MNGCVYRTTDDKCEFYSDYGKGIVSYCDFDDCEEKKPSNADRIRAITDEELATLMEDKGDCPPGECPYDRLRKDITRSDCRKCWLDWLKAPVDKEA